MFLHVVYDGEDTRPSNLNQGSDYVMDDGDRSFQDQLEQWNDEARNWLVEMGFPHNCGSLRTPCPCGKYKATQPFGALNLEGKHYGIQRQ